MNKSTWWVTVSVAAIMLLGAPQGHAGNFTWIGGGVGNRDGEFQIGANWTKPLPTNPADWIPEADDRALFDKAETYTVTFTAGATNQGGRISAGTVTFDVGGYTWETGSSGTEAEKRFDIDSSLLTDTATAIIENGTFDQNYQLRVSFGNDRHGHLILRGLAANMEAESLFISAFGSGSDGYVTFDEGATGTVANLVFNLGTTEGSTGSAHLTLRDAGTELTATLFNMSSGSGSTMLTVADGAKLFVPSFNAREHTIALTNGALMEVGGTMTLSHAGPADTVSTLTVDDSTLVLKSGGNFSAGSPEGRITEVAITGGSEVDVNGNFSLASGTGSGELTLGGASTMVIRSATSVAGGGTFLVAGDTSTGRLHVTGNSTMTVLNVTQMNLAATNAAAYGEIIVSGNGSLLESTLTGGNEAYLNMSGGWTSSVGGESLLAVRDGGKVTLTRDIRVHELGTIEIDRGTIEVRNLLFHHPDNVTGDPDYAGTLRVSLHSGQANATQAMVIGTASHQLNGARFELQLAPGFNAALDDEFYLMSGTGFGGNLTVWDGAQWNDLTHQDLLTAGAYEFEVNISGGDYKLVTTVIPEPGVVGLLGMGFAGLMLRRRRRG